MSLAEPKQLAVTAARYLLERFGVTRVDLGVVLGSGWSSAAESLGTLIGECSLGEVPGFATPVVAGHGATVRLVRTPPGKVAAVFTGRTHLYEGRGVDGVVHGIRTIAAAGASVVVLTNGCGGLNSDWTPGTPVLISDHINLTGTTPLRGPLFIDLTDVYSVRLRNIAKRVDETLPEGVYAQFHGPAYETPAEVRMAGVLGADLVGMSTALEAVAAREVGLEVLGISLVTNAAAGISPEPLSHAEVVQAGDAARGRLTRLLAGIVRLI